MVKLSHVKLKNSGFKNRKKPPVISPTWGLKHTHCRGILRGKIIQVLTKNLEAGFSSSARMSFPGTLKPHSPSPLFGICAASGCPGNALTYNLFLQTLPVLNLSEY